MTHECEQQQENANASTTSIDETVSTNRVKQDNIKTTVVKGAYELVCIRMLGLQEAWKHATEKVTAVSTNSLKQDTHQNNSGKWDIYSLVLQEA